MIIKGIRGIVSLLLGLLGWLDGWRVIILWAPKSCDEGFPATTPTTVDVKVNRRQERGARVSMINCGYNAACLSLWER